MADKNSKTIEELRQRAYNKECMDCLEKVGLLFHSIGHYICGYELWNFCVLTMCGSAPRTEPQGQRIGHVFVHR